MNENLTWRAIGLDDLDEVVELSKICYAADGGLGFLFVRDAIKDRYFADPPGSTLGAFDVGGRLAACTSVYLMVDRGQQRARIVGQVRPDLRGKGVGTDLMQWSQAQASTLLAECAAPEKVMQIATESLTEPAHRLYLAHGFTCVFDEYVMERDLRLPLPDCSLPDDISFTSWQPELAGQFFQAYHASFRERPGFPGLSPAQWIQGIVEDDHVPEWTLLARAGGEPVGFVIGDAELTTDPPGGYIYQVGVVPAQRRRGLASALMLESMRRMQAAGAHSALLTVHLNNPGAIKAYDLIGFKEIGRRARYEKSYTDGHRYLTDEHG